MMESLIIDLTILKLDVLSFILGISMIIPISIVMIITGVRK